MITHTYMWRPCSGIRECRVESEQSAGAGPVCAAPHHGRHLWHEDPVVLCGHVFLQLCLAHRGSLELLHQLHALVSHFYHMRVAD